MSYFFRAGQLLVPSLLLCVCLGVSVFSRPALTAEPITFLEQLDAANTYRLRTYLDSFIPAKTDLNSDGIDEFILRDKTCSSFTLCPHKVIALKGQETVELASFKAQKVALAHQTTNGVRALMVYNNPANDFEYSILKWDAQNSHFKEEAE